MKKVLSFLLVLTLIFGATSLTACELMDEVLGSLGYTKTEPTTTTTTQPEPELPKFSEGLEYKLNSSGKSYTVTDIGECTDVDVIIPAEYEGLPVTAIGEYAFSENDKIKSVVIPETVLSIGDYAFYYCAALESINLPEELFELGEEAFAYCISLKEIVIPKSITEIPSMAFAFCASLEKIEFHDDIELYGENCFSGCISLKELFIPKGIDLNNFTEFYMFLNSLTAFKVAEDNTLLYEIDGNLYLNLYGEVAFMGYAMGKPDEEFTVPSDVDMIYPLAFNFLPWDVEDADDMYAPDFENCKYRSNLKKVTISEGTTTIMMMAFMLCTDLETVVIPRSMEYISVSSFLYCPNLETIEYNGTMEEWHAIEKDEEWFLECPVKEIICTDGIVDPYEEPAPKEVITIWVSPTYGVKEFTQTQIDEFMALYPEFAGYEIVIETVGEGDAGYEILKNPDNAPDIYCFAQSDLQSLVLAGALDPLDIVSKETVKANNDASSVNAATYNGDVYAYPLTSDNGYFLFYDSRYISDEEAKTLEGIIAACERNNKKFGFNLTNGWYVTSFFFAQPVNESVPLCVSEWTYSYETRSFTGVNDTFNSDNGLIALKGMQTLTNSGIWLDHADNFGGTAAVVTGVWNINAVQAYYGDTMKATKLPTYTVDGNEYQLGSYSGHKLIGCKPQEDPVKSYVCSKLALYLSSEECQLERYYEFAWGPSNVKAQANADVKANAPLYAVIEQNKYAQPQGTIPNDWWSIAGYICYDMHDATTDSDLREALANYEEQINGLVSTNK